MTTERTKPDLKPRSKRSTGGQGAALPAESRHEMIATAAYFRAVQRGFCDGDSLDDWLAAEAEIDEQLRRTPAGAC